MELEITDDYIIRIGPGTTVLYLTRGSLGVTVTEAKDRSMAHIDPEKQLDKDFFLEMADLEVVSGLWDGNVSESIQNPDGTYSQVSNPMVPTFGNLAGDPGDTLYDWVHQSDETETFQLFIFVPGWPRKYTINEHRQMLLLERLGVIAS